MAGEDAHTNLIAAVTAAGGDFFTAALSESDAFQAFFHDHLREASANCGDVAVFGVGVQGAFILGELRQGGFWWDDIGNVLFQSSWESGPHVLVYGQDSTRLAENIATAEGQGLTPCYRVQVDTNDVVSLH